MSLNSAIIDTLRKYARPRLVPLSELHESRELPSDEHTNSGELWETLKSFLPDKREQRLASLLFHCNLKPREIVHFCPQEFSDVQEIYQMSRLIMNRLLRNSDQLRWKLGHR